MTLSPRVALLQLVTGNPSTACCNRRQCSEPSLFSCRSSRGAVFPGMTSSARVFSLVPFQAERCARLLPHTEWPPSPDPEPPCRPDAARQWPETGLLAIVCSWAHAQPASIPACLRPVLRAESFWHNPQLLWCLPSFRGCLPGSPAPRPPQLPWHRVLRGPGHSSRHRLQGVLKGPDALSKFPGTRSPLLAFSKRASLS